MRAAPEPGFEGAITIQWEHWAGAGPPMQGALGRGADGECINAYLDLTVHSPAGGWTWAEMTMFAGADGKPVYQLPPVTRDLAANRRATKAFSTTAHVREKRFAFLVTGMAVIGSPSRMQEAS